MRFSILIVMTLFGLTGLPANARAAEHTTDALDAVKKAIADDKAIMLDVREKSEWEGGHLKDAKFLPMSTLRAGAKAEDVAKVIPKDKIVYCHCSAGIRCLKAADILTKMGYEVRPLKPGYQDLLKAGFTAAPK